MADAKMWWTMSRREENKKIIATPQIMKEYNCVGWQFDCACMSRQKMRIFTDWTEWNYGSMKNCIDESVLSSPWFSHDSLCWWTSSFFFGFWCVTLFSLSLFQPQSLEADRQIHLRAHLYTFPLLLLLLFFFPYLSSSYCIYFFFFRSFFSYSVSVLLR